MFAVGRIWELGPESSQLLSGIFERGLQHLPLRDALPTSVLARGHMRTRTQTRAHPPGFPITRCHGIAAMSELWVIWAGSAQGKLGGEAGLII